ncbi:MAG TPA: cupin domain-containing protein [Nocardioides sp.]|uniref:cupin domain-containing protein n=1 Tax=Nocardioides sp. TaxID=35761 RepID=UPI002F3E3431
MEAISLTALADEQLAVARQAPAGRASHTVHGGQEHALRQTLVALAAGQELAEHNSPGEATLHVVTGRVRLIAGDDAWEGGAGDHVTIPPLRHALRALEDSAVLLTVSMAR